MDQNAKLRDKSIGNSRSSSNTEIICPDGSSPLSSTDIIEPRESNEIQVQHTNLHEIYNSQTKYQLKSSHQSKIIAFSGALAGFLSGIAVCPLDVAKTRLQAQGLQVTNLENKYYHGLINTLRTIVYDEGIRGIYKGLTPIILGYFPTWMIYFSVYERCKKFYPIYFNNNDFISNSFSAISAGTVSTIATNPIWVVKTRLMLQTHIARTRTHYKGTLDAFVTIYQQEGIRALYAGLIPSFLGLFHVAIHFPVFEQLKEKFNCYEKKLIPNTSEYEYSINLERLIMASCISKMMASSITYPHEILRTRMQLKSDLPNSLQRRIIPLIKTIYIQEGLRGFYSGFTTNLVRTVPASAITMVSFEYFRSVLTALDNTLEH
ncbi:hypothetical protein TBLA_0A01000 [Henningerozyma blattae CBS 6284]|uniref:Mitochondrial nicotinamide adenine dinucleotide transporter 1 n=1 Tax=Henningerozyma blattae (strain ATCC 34711 / CBS 6284 / DSM 70876 / NBRC 10599 / NRRL Y-10934 / UCD 77-7) TaxID=1071380 RepID=I2GUU8_HENB6|nr:hypothetical protein TBLA_0A01000 [Tetrapisispora blattae CBS 6284]CCH57900.1 hypothetical protein TBLA_0A01000 [Tetrapisispora blattae CBS 6284]